MSSSILFLFVPVLAKKCLLVLGILTSIFGIAEIILSLTVLNGTYFGSWYAGMLSLILGIVSMRNSIKANLTILNLRWILPLCVATLGEFMVAK